jgi:hypothetical protein
MGLGLAINPGVRWAYVGSLIATDYGLDYCSNIEARSKFGCVRNNRISRKLLVLWPYLHERT